MLLKRCFMVSEVERVKEEKKKSSHRVENSWTISLVNLHEERSWNEKNEGKK